MSNRSNSIFYRLDFIFNKQASLEDDKSLYYKSTHEKLAKKDSSNGKVTTADSFDESPSSFSSLDEHNRKTAVFNNILAKAKKKLKQKSSTCSDLKSLTYEDCDEFQSTHKNRFDHTISTEFFMDEFDKKQMAP
jgi:hypothetical protein